MRSIQLLFCTVWLAVDARQLNAVRFRKSLYSTVFILILCWVLCFIQDVQCYMLCAWPDCEPSLAERLNRTWLVEQWHEEPAYCKQRFNSGMCNTFLLLLPLLLQLYVADHGTAWTKFFQCLLALSHSAACCMSLPLWFACFLLCCWSISGIIHILYYTVKL